MAPPTRVRARVRPRTLCEEAVEGFCDAFDHPHELVVHGGRDRALCHKVAVGVWPPVSTRQDIGRTIRGGPAHKIKACTARL